jgi:hypothetical protein
MKTLSISNVSLKKGLGIGSGGTYSVSIFNTHVYVLEIEDVFFRHNSAVMMPDSTEDITDTAPKEDRITGLAVLKTVFIRLMEFPDQKIIIAGHTDTSGDANYNLTLSDLRAESILCILDGNKERWVKISKDKHKNEDIQQILLWVYVTRAVDCHPGKIDGIIGSKTKSALKNFQTYYNEYFKQSIKVDGIAGSETWGAFYDVYQDELKKMLDVNEPEMMQYRTTLRWQFQDHKFIGCGENWPVEEASKDNYRSRRNRRVEILFFDPEEKFDLECHSGKKCDKKLCSIYPVTSTNRIYLPVHVHKSPQSVPTFFTIEQPGAANYVRMHSLYAYLVYFESESDKIKSLNRYIVKEGKLCSYTSGNAVSLDCNKDVYIYFSHRYDLLELSREKYFKKDKSGLPLLGPIKIPCGPKPEIELNIWDQNDWIVIHGVRIDGERPDYIKMAEWNENYSIGYYNNFKDSTEIGFFIHGDCRKKQEQEKWKGGIPVELVHLGNPGNNPMWAGTLSGSPSKKVKILFEHNVNSGGKLYVTSFNEVEHNGKNIDLPAHHTYNEELVNRLSSLTASDQSTSEIDKFPDPPARYLVPGDMCWQDQGQTNHCGPYSFSTAMNYWFPYTNNPAEKNGKLYAKEGNVDDTINGARTPKDIVNAAEKFKMFGRDNDAEELDRSRAMKLLKLWLTAGIPVLILVKEEYKLTSYHWKTVVGYDGNRFFMNNSGADLETTTTERTGGVDYEKAPVGNDVDSETAFYKKWKAAGGDIVDKVTSVDECTFIPLYPKDPIFKGKVAR